MQLISIVTLLSRKETGCDPVRSTHNAEKCCQENFVYLLDHKMTYNTKIIPRWQTLKKNNFISSSEELLQILVNVDILSETLTWTKGVDDIFKIIKEKN